MTTAQDVVGKVVSLTHQPLLPPQEIILVLLTELPGLLEAESTSGPLYDQKAYVIEKFQ